MKNPGFPGELPVFLFESQFGDFQESRTGPIGAGKKLRKKATVRSGAAFPQVNPHIGRHPRIPFGIFVKLRFAPCAAEVIFLIPIRARTIRCIFINYHKTDRIRCRGNHLVCIDQRGVFFLKCSSARSLPDIFLILVYQPKPCGGFSHVCWMNRTIF